jgi:hypothetical protein
MLTYATYSGAYADVCYVSKRLRATTARFPRVHVLILLRSSIYVSSYHYALAYIYALVELAGLCSEAARYMARIFLFFFFFFCFVFFLSFFIFF